MIFFKKFLSVNLAMLFVAMNLVASSVVNLDRDPVFKDFQKLQQDMNKIFENFHIKYFNMDVDDKFFEKASFSPKVDLKDRKDFYEVKVNLPGVDKAKTKIKVEKNILTIEAKSENVKEERDDKMIKKERFVGLFQRSLVLPKDADGDKLSSKYKDGVLSIKIPKK